MKDQSVTTIVHHHIKNGDEGAFLSWLDQTRNKCKSRTGYIDSSLVDKDKTKDGAFISIFRFDNYTNLRNWVDSDIHRVQMEKLQDISKVEAKLNSYEGLEYWFQEDSPNTFKMSVVTYIGLLPLVLVIPGLFEKVTGITGIPNTVLNTALTVLLMSYLVMPGLNKLFKRFL